MYRHRTVNVSAAFDHSAKVLTSKGAYKPVYQLKVGDSVLNRDGKPVKVKEVVANKQAIVYKVKHANWHVPTFVTPDHPIWVADVSFIDSFNYLDEDFAGQLTDDKIINSVKW